MELNMQKEQFSLAYIRAVAAAAGFVVDNRSVDDDSIDLQISSSSKSGKVKSPKLELQAKCTADSPLAADSFSYPLPIKNYEDLRDPDVLVPRILVVVRVPEDTQTWTSATDQELLLRHCGYWTSLRGMEETTNTESVSVPVKKENRFTVAALSEIMKKISRGEAL